MKGTGDNGAVQMSGLPLPPLSLFESLLLLFYFGKRKEKLEALLSCTSSRLLVFFFAFAKGTGIVLDFPNRPDPRIHGAASKVWRNLNDEETKRSKQSHALSSLIYVPSSTDSISRRTLLLFVLAEQKQQRCVASQNLARQHKWILGSAAGHRPTWRCTPGTCRGISVRRFFASLPTPPRVANRLRRRSGFDVVPYHPTPSSRLLCCHPFHFTHSWQLGLQCMAPAC
jgi:hypothetical protein